MVNDVVNYSLGFFQKMSSLGSLGMMTLLMSCMV